MLKLNIFQKTAVLTIFATLFLILVGGLVRASGAGLGCPDWPKCFGLWIPPLSQDAIIDGFDSEQFNVVKTWTEYINRLIGVLIGLLITATFVFSIKYRKIKPSVTIASALAFILVLFQGWLGGMVVRSGLSEWIITIHMITAMVIVGMLIYAAFQALSEVILLKLQEPFRSKLILASTVLLILTFIQMGLGTQVREAIDTISRGNSGIERGMWLDHVGVLDDIHRSFSWLILFSSIHLGWLSAKNNIQPFFKKLILFILIMIAGQILIGVVLAYGGMPASFQVMHLFGSSVMMSAILLLVFSSRASDVLKENSPD